jgi:hypothetical protein
MNKFFGNEIRTLFGMYVYIKNLRTFNNFICSLLNLQLWWSNKHIITSSMLHEVEILKVKVLDIVLRFSIKY